MTKHEELDLCLTALAQGVINIDTGLTTIEIGSRIHRAMSRIVEMYVRGNVHATEHSTKPAAFEGAWPIITKENS